ncbi:MAG: benzoate-CoA ligase family protein [Chitinispirillaceae bacterium]|nr:benzoate-CoA ligase family protein [Chitinispirillaceae bacterium]
MKPLEIPDRFNAATIFIDRHLNEGRADKPAILCGDTTVTYRGLSENVNRFGNVLLGLGVRMEERVAIVMPDCHECVFAFFGAIKTGAVAIPLNTNLKPEDYEYLLNDSRSQVLVIDAALLDKLNPVRKQLRYLKHIIVARGDAGADLSFDKIMKEAPTVLEPADMSKDDSAFWLYSSGTTGFPKGTIHLQHDMMVEAEYYAKQTIGLLESDLSFSVAKLFHAYGLGNGLYFPLWVGGTTILLPDRPLPKTIYETIDRYRPTVFYSVPTSFAATLHLAEQENRTSLQRVRMCVSAGEPLPKPLFESWKERFKVDILDGIGSTEILHIFISNRPGRIKPGSTGEVVTGYEAKILDDNDNEVGVDEAGTLYMKGDSIAGSYWNKHEKTKTTFCGEWINTHDKYRKDADGFFWYEGRADDMIKVSGLYVSPAEVESILMSHPSVLESGVVGVFDNEGLMKPCAYVVLKNKFDASDELADELKKFVKSKTLPHKYPRTIHFVDELPKTATGKIQRFKLREMAAQTAAAAK